MADAKADAVAVADTVADADIARLVVETLSDFPEASAVERAAIMCMERVSLLETRLTDAEGRLDDAEARHRDLLGKTLMLMCSDVLTMYLEVLMWAVGVPAATRVLWREDRRCKSSCEVQELMLEHVDSSHGGRPSPRALVLHGIATGHGVGDRPCPCPWTTLATEVDFPAMVGAMTLGELESFWTWRIATTHWHARNRRSDGAGDVGARGDVEKGSAP